MLELSKLKAVYNSCHGVIFGFLLLSFAFDFVDKIDIFYDIGLIKFNRILKAIFLVYSLVFIVTHFKYVYKNLKLIVVIVIVLSLIFLLKNNFSERYVNEYIRYIFVLLTLPLLSYTYIQKNQNLLPKLYACFNRYFV